MRRVRRLRILAAWPHYPTYLVLAAPDLALPCGTHKIQPSRRATTTVGRAKSGKVAQPQETATTINGAPDEAKGKEVADNVRPALAVDKYILLTRSHQLSFSFSS